jgi:hypothetical protein
MEQTFIEGRAKYGGDAWSSMIVKLLEDSVGTPLRAPGFPARLGADDQAHGNDLEAASKDIEFPHDGI